MKAEDQLGGVIIIQGGSSEVMRTMLRFWVQSV